MRVVIIMRNTLSTATIACDWSRRELQIQRLGVQILMSINNKKRVKVRVRLEGGGRLVKREVWGLGTIKDRGECQNKNGGEGGEMQKN